jgi:drug/metabolite transporter (DMT)-like permease
VALLGALCVATVGIALRRLAQEESHLTILLYLGLVGSLMTGLPTAFLFVVPTWSELGLLLVLAATGVMGQICLMRGFRVGEASALAVVDYTRLPFSAALGLLLFLEPPDLGTVAGALIIAGATLYIARREAAPARARREDGHG